MVCPLFQEVCRKDKCAWWVKLTANQEEHGKCAIAWLPILLVELRSAFERKEKDSHERTDT